MTNLSEEDFYIAHPDELTINVEINWTKPAPHDLLFTNEVPEDNTAYFYAITSCVDKGWWAYYIGMVYDQTVSLNSFQQTFITG